MTSSAETFTYWSLLGLPPGSTPDQIKQAFMREAKIWHPDLNGNNQNAEERFKWINEAYSILSDPRKRFEWEVAGQPSFKIETIPNRNESQNTYHSSSQSNGSEHGFSFTEKLTITLITIVSLIIINNFVL